LQDKLFLISDAVTDSETGDYRFRFADDRYVDANGTLAGSALTMWQAVQNAIRLAGIEPAEALRMASTYPARVMGRADTLGKIAPGYEAKFVMFDDEWNLVNQSGVNDLLQVYP
jgi:N-acetylglucosamine-6-phosphate deacetylase